jgi:hypothetical protein
MPQEASAVLTGNLIATANLTSSSEDSTFVLSNLRDKIAANVFKWTSAPTAGAITIKADDTDPPTTVVASPALAAGNVWADVAVTSARYLRIEVDAHWLQVDFGSSIAYDTVAIINHNWDQTDLDAQLGELVVETRTVLPRAHRYGKSRIIEENDTIHETIRGVVWAFHLFERKVRIFTWRILESQLSTFEVFHQAVQGRIEPFVFILDEAIVTSEVLYVRKDKDLVARELRNPTSQGTERVYDVGLAVVEESAGEEVT